MTSETLDKISAEICRVSDCNLKHETIRGIIVTALTNGPMKDVQVHVTLSGTAYIKSDGNFDGANDAHRTDLIDRAVSTLQGNGRLEVDYDNALIQQVL